MSEFSKRLVNLRESHDWSKTYVANHIGLKNMQTYANWEYGKSEPDQDSTIKLANLFNVTVDYLYGRNQTPAWATKKDTLELRNFIDENSEGGMTFDGEDLTKEEKEKVEIAMTQIFWEKLKKIKAKEAKKNGENK
ncbi:helix-turn-helix domain-containing protein [Companilactobacillus alimentarius]|uniref:helix-turn-helix domain-containing protein n=1 Tax=Companilactobacillus alimentarius TaxID=1602 RepID=UPI0028B7EF7A|nr:helix-turn-helix transcriptional regulator [Companilactobacillus alimentarius]MDT6953180.1 helix-turn-helix transcriptional regulator [Companilactobacillus alimentarius]